MTAKMGRTVYSVTTVPILGMPEVANVNMTAIAERAIIVTKSHLGQQYYYRDRTRDEGRDVHRNVIVIRVCICGQAGLGLLVRSFL